MNNLNLSDYLKFQEIFYTNHKDADGLPIKRIAFIKRMADKQLQEHQ